MSAYWHTISGKVLGASKQGEFEQLVKLIAAFFSSNVLVMLTQTISGLLVARWAGPVHMGYLNTMGVFLAYAPILLLGINNGLNRELPYLLGQGQTSTVQSMANTAWWWVKSTGLVSGLLLVSIGSLIWLRGNNYLGQACIVYALIVPLTFFSQNVEVTYRTSGDFLNLSKIRFVNALLAIATVPAVLFSSWFGLLTRAAFLQIAYNFLLHRKRRIIPVASFSIEGFKRLLKVGLPIFGVGYLFSVFAVLDRTLILKFLGTREMGLYTPAIQVAAGLAILPASINQIIYPKMCELYGRTGSARSLARLAFLPVIILSIALLPIFALGWWLVDPFVRIVLPQYVEGIAVTRWIMVSMYFWCLSTPQDCFITINKLLPYVLAICLGALTNISVTMAFLDQGWGLSAIGIGYASGIAVVVVLSIVFASYYIFKPTESSRGVL